ncbi:hypothetical protein D1872_227430 [compost metagenome]
MIRNVRITSAQFHNCVETKVIERNGDRMLLGINLAADIFPNTTIIETEYCNCSTCFIYYIFIICKSQCSTLGRYDFAI